MIFTNKCCRACGKSKALADFYSNGTGYFPSCKECYMGARRAAYRRDPEKAKEQVRRYRARLKAQRLATTPGAPKTPKVSQ
ncbi:hypothetical protein DES41_10535 [Pseudorhodoferax soli]|uniref:Uncharacterized protein n=1 Tax=Pseudorhodoferax soli TaxID=545864 RepID=A0A368XRD7_9BURK|nr:hypothetical protein DES41_10535 [Pseudorhodoferax soli]